MHTVDGRADEAGFSLLEMLVSAAISLVTLGLLYSTQVAFRRLHFDHTETVEVERSLRGAFDFLGRDLERAGYRLVGNAELASFGTVFASSDASDAYAPDRLTVWSNADVAEAVLTETMAARDAALRIDTVEGFAEGLTVWIVGRCTDETLSREAFVVTSAEAGPPRELGHDEPENPDDRLACRYLAGSKVVRLRQVTYALAPADDGTFDLTRGEDEGAPALLATGITALRFTYLDGDDPPAEIEPRNSVDRLAVRRLQVTLAGRSLERSRKSGITAEATFTGTVAPRNLVLQDTP